MGALSHRLTDFNQELYLGNMDDFRVTIFKKPIYAGNGVSDVRYIFYAESDAGMYTVECSRKDVLSCSFKVKENGEFIYPSQALHFSELSPWKDKLSNVMLSYFNKGG